MSFEPAPIPARKALLVFADSLAYYGPQGGLPADDPRIWPNIVASEIGWDLELIGRIGWTCRDVWWAATQDPRSWAAIPRAGAVIFATSGMDSLPSPLPTALREAARLLGTRELTRDCELGSNDQKLLERAIDKLNLSARAYHRIIKLARTIADLENSKEIAESHLLEALQYRHPGRQSN